MSIRGAELVVRHLEAQGVRHVFGVPGAKIDRVYDERKGDIVDIVDIVHLFRDIYAVPVTGDTVRGCFVVR